MTEAADSSFARALMRSYVTQGVAGILKIATPIAVARLVGPEDFGEYALAVVVVQLAFNLGNLGISSGTTFVLRRGGVAPVAVRSSMVLSLALGSAVTVLVLGLVGVADLWAEELGDVLLALALASVPAYFVLYSALGVLLGQQDFVRFNRLSLAAQAGLLIVSVAALMVHGSATSAVAAWTATYMIAGATAWAMVVGRSGAGWAIDRSHTSEVLHFGVRTHASTIVSFLSFRLDVVFVAAILDARSAGLYAAAVTIGEAVWFFSQVGSTLLFARVSGETDKSKRRRLTDAVTRWVVLASGLLASCVALAAHSLVRVLFGTDYSVIVPTLRILLVGVVALSLSRMLANYVAAVGRPGANILGSVVALGVNVALNLLFIRWWGISGAAAASAVSYLVTAAHRIFLYSTVDGRMHPFRFLLPQKADLSLLRKMVSR